MFDWPRLPWNQRGSGKGQGRRCKEVRHICLLRQNDTLPIVVRIPVTSIRNWSQFYFQTAGLLSAQKVVEMSLEKASNKSGQSYSLVNFKLVDTLSPELGLSLDRQYKSLMKDAFDRQRMLEPAGSEEEAF